jgi:hypothetical protein
MKRADYKIPKSRMSAAENQFRAKYPHTRVAVEDVIPHTLVRYTVFAGDYPCGESTTRYKAFEYALKAEAEGLIMPDPEELTSNGERAK